MAHAYQLYNDVDAQCLCCRAMQPFHFTSAADQVVCSFCVRHTGPDRAERRDTDHVALWLELYTELQDVHAAAVADATAESALKDQIIAERVAEVDELRGLLAESFDSTPRGGIREVLETDLVKRAERKTELAERRTDRAMAVLWRLAQRHSINPGDPALCGCGMGVALCPDQQALELVRTELAEWETRNVQRAEAGQRHALPPEHPSFV
ncbi:hypothetical protein GCM10022381_09120 [Leifsonia kafniensis]|uniref:Uncharacterized protein n=1 Tax=Leifsonia kafniensis TaxID=475957 RepID=A0ABP7K938_9MICO